MDAVNFIFRFSSIYYQSYRDNLSLEVGVELQEELTIVRWIPF